jgi:hypothetical protein
MAAAGKSCVAYHPVGGGFLQLTEKVFNFLAVV